MLQIDSGSTIPKFNLKLNEIMSDHTYLLPVKCPELTFNFQFDIFCWIIQKMYLICFNTAKSFFNFLYFNFLYFLKTFEINKNVYKFILI